MLNLKPHEMKFLAHCWTNHLEYGEAMEQAKRDPHLWRIAAAFNNEAVYTGFIKAMDGE